MNLTNEEIRIKVAESMGWRDLKTTWEGYHEWMHPDGRVRYGTKTCKVACLPNYPESLDACAQFEATLTKKERCRYADYICDMCYDGSPDPNVEQVISATARQRCLAYLKTKNLIP